MSSQEKSRWSIERPAATGGKQYEEKSDPAGRRGKHPGSAPAGVFLLLAGRTGGATEAGEQRRRLCFGHGSPLPPTAPDDAPGVTSAGRAREHEGTASIAVSPRTRLDESSGAAHVLGERSIGLLERRRLEQERGAGGDHDLPYHFALSLSLPQVLAWTRLLGR